MRVNELLTNIEVKSHIILKIDDLDTVTFQGTKLNICSSEEYTKAEKHTAMQS